MYGFNSFYFIFLLAFFVYAVILAFLFGGKLNNEENEKKAAFIFLLFLPLFLLSALRGEEVGGDLEYYIPYFDDACQAESFSDLMQISGHEPGYIIFTKLIGSISSSHRFFLLVTSAVSLIGPACFIYKFSTNPIASVMIYYSMGFYTNSFNNIRQAIAMSIIFCAYPLLFDKRFKQFLGLVLLATLFHYSAFIIALVYPIIKKEISMEKMFSFLVLGVTLFLILGSSLLSFFVDLINLIYMKYDFGLGEEQSAGWGLLAFYFVILLMMGVVLLLVEDYITQFQKYVFSFLFLFQMLAVLTQMYAPIFPSMTRITQYFFIPVTLSIPYICSLIKDEFFKTFVAAFAFVIAFVFFSMTYSHSSDIDSNTQGVIPYVFLDTEIF